jgi:hypothetical protein
VDSLQAAIIAKTTLVFEDPSTEEKESNSGFEGKVHHNKNDNKTEDEN